MKRILALILGIILLSTAFAGCGIVIRRGDIEIGGIGQIFEVNDRAEQEMSGVDKVVISTVSDDLNLKSGGDKVLAELQGQCRSVSKPVWLETHKDGSTLYIEVKYPQTISNNDTTLTVTIPVEYAGSLTMNTVSGDVQAEDLPFKLQKTTVGTVSGEINFSTASFTSLKVNSISGDVSVSGIAAETAASTVSGEVKLDYAAFAATTVGTVSGNVDAGIPTSASFKVDFNSVSGDFSSSHPGIAVDRADGGFSGSASGGTELIKVNTTSGDFKISGN
jgi:lia operon protein LiaG